MDKMCELVFEAIGLSICEIRTKIKNCYDPKHVVKYAKAIKILNKCMENRRNEK